MRTDRAANRHYDRSIVVLTSYLYSLERKSSAMAFENDKRDNGI